MVELTRSRALAATRPVAPAGEPDGRCVRKRDDQGGHRVRVLLVYDLKNEQRDPNQEWALSWFR